MRINLWQLLNTDIRCFLSPDGVDGTLDVAKATLELASVLQEQDVRNISPWIEKGASFLDVLTTPEAELVESVIPFAKIATGLLRYSLRKTKETPGLTKSIVLICFKAYSESLADFLKMRGFTSCSKLTMSFKEELKAFEIDEIGANQALVCFHQSMISDFMKKLMMTKLLQSEISHEDVSLLTERAAYNTHRYITKAWSELPDDLRILGPASLNDWRKEQEKYSSIEMYLKEYISSNPTDLARRQQWCVFDEEFTLKDIYVQPNVQILDSNGEPAKKSIHLSIEDWAEMLLNDSEKQGQILFIQGSPGRGKSVFCKIFADKIRQKLYPIWIPILIRLRDIPKIQPSFENTLRDSISANFVKSNSGWLADRNTRFLFFLDGFDELLMEGRTSGGLDQFLRQISQFQRDCTNPEMGHRVVLTGRQLALLNIEHTLPANMQRVNILPFGARERDEWLMKWSDLVGQDSAGSFREFLEDEKCPERLKGSKDEIGLAQEPLLMYLLAAMHRDGELNLDTFSGKDSSKAKILIYEKTLDWVLTKQRSSQLNRDITELESEGLRRILSEAGICVVQSGGECASIKMIEGRLKTDPTAQERLQGNPLRNALASFYLQPGSQGEGTVEFAHKSFSEFLYAKHIKQSMEDWIYSGKRTRFLISDEQMAWNIYDLLDGNHLTIEVTEYLITLILDDSDFDYYKLHDRLSAFFLDWRDGLFIDKPPAENLPQRKMLQMASFDKIMGIREVDIHTGINVLIILLELSRASNTNKK